MTEEQCVYEQIGDLNRRGSAPEAQPGQPDTAHVAIENAIGVIIDLRDENAKLWRTVAAQDPAELRRTIEDVREFTVMAGYWMTRANETLAQYNADRKKP